MHYKIEDNTATKMAIYLPLCHYCWMYLKITFANKSQVLLLRVGTADAKGGHCPLVPALGYGSAPMAALFVDSLLWRF